METISCPAHRFDITGMSRILFDFLPDPVDMDSNRGTVAQRIDAPDAFKQMLPRKNNAGIFHEELQELEFPIRQMDLLLPAEYAAGTGLQDEVPACKLLRVMPAVPLELLVTCEMRLGPRHELAGAEGLRHIVVRAEPKAADLVDIRLARRDDDDRDVELGADAAAKVEAVDMRQHEIQDHEIKTAVQGSILTLDAIFLDDHLKIRCLQIVPFQFRNLAVVLHDQNLFHVHSHLSLLLPCALCFFRQPNTDAEPLRQGRARPDAAAHRFNNPCRNGKPEPAALGDACPGLIRAVK